MEEMIFRELLVSLAKSHSKRQPKIIALRGVLKIILGISLEQRSQTPMPRSGNPDNKNV